MNEFLKYLISRASYLLWVVSCICDSALFSISLLTFNNVLEVILSLILVILLIFIYQFGVDYLDFKEAENMFEWDTNGEDDEDKDI